MTSKTKDHPGVKFPPPLVFIILLLTGYGMDKFLKLSIVPRPTWEIIAGTVLVLVSFAGIVYMLWFFRANKTEIEPWKTTSNIITSGPFKYSRNPVYLMFCGMAIGFGFIFNSYWILLSFIPSLILVYFIAVKKEEIYLEEKFGQEYLNYKARVRRWL